MPATLPEKSSWTPRGQKWRQTGHVGLTTFTREKKKLACWDVFDEAFGGLRTHRSLAERLERVLRSVPAAEIQGKEGAEAT